MRILNGFWWIMAAWACVAIGAIADAGMFSIAGIVCGIIGVVCAERDYRDRNRA